MHSGLQTQNPAAESPKWGQLASLATIWADSRGRKGFRLALSLTVFATLGRASPEALLKNAITWLAVQTAASHRLSGETSQRRAAYSPPGGPDSASMVTA
jgi:hypothetical protein